MKKASEWLICNFDSTHSRNHERLFCRCTSTKIHHGQLFQVLLIVDERVYERHQSYLGYVTAHSYNCSNASDLNCVMRKLVHLRRKTV